MDDHDRGGLTPDEAAMITAVEAGEVADLGGGRVRADVLRALILSVAGSPSIQSSSEIFAGRGTATTIRIRRGEIDGALDLEGVSTTRPIILTGIRINGDKQRGALILRDARLYRLAMQSCDLAGPFVADRASIASGLFIGGGSIGGALIVRGARIDGAFVVEGVGIGDGARAISGNGVRVEGPMILRKSRCSGLVSLARAKLGAGLQADGLTCTVRTGSGSPTPGPAVVLDGAEITGDVGLEGASFDAALSLAHTRVVGGFTGTRLAIGVGGIAAEGLRVGQALVLDWAKISGAVDLDGAVVEKRVSGENLEIEGGEIALTARVARFGADVSLPRFRAVGELRLTGIRVAGQIRLSEARVFGTDLAIRADGMRVDGGWFMSRATVVGLVRCPAASFGNQFRMRGTSIKVEEGAALLASGSVFERDVQLDGSFATIGAVLLDGVDIKGTLDLRDSRIKSAAIARGVGDHAVARAGRLKDGDATDLRRQRGDDDETAMSLVDARIGRLRMPRRTEHRPRGIVDLSRANVSSFEDWAAGWPAAEGRTVSLDGRDIDHLVLDGFAYAHLANPSGLAAGDAAHHASGDGARVGRARIAWLDAQRREDVREHFKPQPWVQLANRLAAQGYDDAAREVAIVQRRRARRASSVTSVELWQSRMLDWLALYGFNPWRTVLWMAAVVLTFTAVWSWAASHCSEAGCRDETILVMTATDGYTPDALGRGYPDFHPLAYSLDVFIPFVSLGHEDHWRVNMRFGPLVEIDVPSLGAVTSLLLGGEPRSMVAPLKITLGSLLYVLALIEQLLGLVLTSLAITGFTGLLKPRQ